MKKKKIIIAVLIFVILGFCIYGVYQIILRRLYPTTYKEYVEKYADEYGIDKEWIYALIKAESNFKIDCISQSGAVGLMQLMEETAVEVADDIGIKDIDLKNPECNIMLGVKYFASLLKYYDNNYYLAIVAYNAGIGTVTKWIDNGTIKKDGTDIENVPYKETNNYIRKVLRNYRIYQKLYKS